MHASDFPRGWVPRFKVADHQRRPREPLRKSPLDTGGVPLATQALGMVSSMANLESTQPSDSLQSNFGFVMNVEALRGSIEFPLVDGHQLRRATPREIV